jgi:thiamine biosynthesis lipoprotein
MPLTQVSEGWRHAFQAMASPCEVRAATQDPDLARRLGEVAEAEAARIERKYSRYRDDSVISQINRSDGRPVAVDPETAALLDYAAQCHQLSDGRFDVTSGVLRRVWRFDQSDAIPTRTQVAEIMPLVGWEKVIWRRPSLTLPPGMEIDFGGLGKEYAVDRAVLEIKALVDVPALVNFGGDLRVTGPRKGGARWRVTLESVDAERASEGRLDIADGALTTSGDARRYLLKDGVRYSHILDPRTGWPVEDPPRAVTVAAPTCMEAGVLSTLAMLHGRDAEAFLQREQLQAWWIR